MKKEKKHLVVVGLSSYAGKSFSVMKVEGFLADVSGVEPELLSFSEGMGYSQFLYNRKEKGIIAENITEKVILFKDRQSAIKAGFSNEKEGIVTIFEYLQNGFSPDDFKKYPLTLKEKTKVHKFIFGTSEPCCSSCGTPVEEFKRDDDTCNCGWVGVVFPEYIFNI